MSPKQPSTAQNPQLYVGERERAHPLLAFVHVPKTGGTSIQAVLEGVLMDRPAFNIHHPDQAEEFLSLPEERQLEYFAVFGHMPFGIDKYINRPVRYMTFLRHPVERQLSDFGHLLRHDQPGSDLAREMGIAWTALPSNVVVARLTDHPFRQKVDESNLYWIKVPGALTRDDLQAAKNNITRCDFIGIHETYESDLRALADLAGHRIVIPSILPNEQVGANRISASDLTADQIKAIEIANDLDMELYNYALDLRRAWGGPIRPEARRNEAWRPLDTRWSTRGLDFTNPVSLPDRVVTPSTAWGYGAVSEVITSERPLTVRIKATLVSGQVGLCLISPAGDVVISETRKLTRGAVREIVFLTSEGSARICIRNHGCDGEIGEADIHSVDVLQDA